MRSCWIYVCLLATLALSAPVATADIFEWEWVDPGDHSLGRQESTTLVPDGVGVVAEAFADLSSLDLTMAWLPNRFLANAILIETDLNQADLSGADFKLANLTNADLSQANLHSARFDSTNLAGADLSEANLSYAAFYGANLALANFTDAEVRWASFRSSTDFGFTETQLYSTASYKSRDLSRISLYDNDLTTWNFSGQNLTNAIFSLSLLASADLNGANLTETSFHNAVLDGANLVGATLVDTVFENATLIGANFSQTELINVTFEDATLTNSNFNQSNFSNASFVYATLPGAIFSQASLLDADFFSADLTDVDFSQANLSSARFSNANLTDADFSGAEISGAQFGGNASFAESQLYSTASYQAGDLTEIAFVSGFFQGWGFEGQNLSSSYFYYSSLSGSNFSGANLSRASFIDSSLEVADFTGADIRGALFFFSETLQITGADFTGANLTGTSFFDTTLDDTDFSQSDMRNASTINPAPNNPKSHNTIHPDGTVYGLDILPGETMRLWDYDPETPLPIHVQDVMQIDAFGALRVVIEDDSWGSTLTFESGIDVLLDGTLDLLVSPDSESTIATLVGTTFELFDWTGVSPLGTFAQITTMEGVLWDTSDLYTTGEVTLLELPGYLFGDFTEDGLVGGIDFLNWQSGFGAASGATGAEGDADGDGDVDRADLVIWKQRYSTNIEVVPGDFNADGSINGIDFLQWQLGGGLLPWSEAELDDWERNFGSGSSLPVASFGFVPEPSTAGLALLMLLSIAARRTDWARIVR